jgi:hypothetical protein
MCMCRINNMIGLSQWSMAERDFSAINFAGIPSQISTGKLLLHANRNSTTPCSFSIYTPERVVDFQPPQLCHVTSI